MSTPLWWHEASYQPNLLLYWIWNILQGNLMLCRYKFLALSIFWTDKKACIFLIWKYQCTNDSTCSYGADHQKAAVLVSCIFPTNYHSCTKSGIVWTNTGWQHATWFLWYACGVVSPCWLINNHILMYGLLEFILFRILLFIHLQTVVM